MAELDFSKIFGETATSKASFTDENYLNGWGYLGSTPPPYQLFDYLQSLNDKKSKYLYDKTIENDNKLALHNTNATAHTAILNAIKAISGMGAYDIAPSKTITAMIPLLGFGGIVAQKLDSNGYVKFANGFTIQWGYAADVPSGTQINFPILFSNGICKVVCAGKENVNRNSIQFFSVHSITGDGFKVLSKRFDGATTNDFFDWIAVGF